MEGGEWTKFNLFRTAWLACPSGRPQLELLLEYINDDLHDRDEPHQMASTGLRIRRFDDLESVPVIEDSVREMNAYLVQGFTKGSLTVESNPSTELMDLLFTIEAARQCQARAITLDLGFFPFSRGDKQFKGGQPATAKAVARMLDGQAGPRLARRVITYDLHNPSIQNYFRHFTMDPLSAIPLFAIYFRNLPELCGEKVVVVAPDSGGVARAETLANYLGVGMAYTHKVREQGKPPLIKGIVGDVDGCVAIAVDDMIGTGGTILGSDASSPGLAAWLYDRKGAKQVYVAATHGLFTAKQGDMPVEERFRQFRCRGQGLKVVVADTIHRSPGYLQSNKDWLAMITIAGHKSDIVLGPFFGDRVRDILERYSAVASGRLTYECPPREKGSTDGRKTLNIPSGFFYSMKRQRIAYDALEKLILPNKAYLRAWQGSPAKDSLRPESRHGTDGPL